MRNQASPIPAFPVILSEGVPETPSPLQYAEPVHTDWSSPDAIGPDGPPIGDFFGTVDNPSIPNVWNTQGHQVDPGVTYDHNDLDTVQFSGTGSMKMITEPENNLGGLVQLFPFGRYASRPLYEDDGNLQYATWDQPLATDGTEPALLTNYVLPVQVGEY